MSDPVEQLIEQLRRNASGLQEGLSGRLMQEAADALARQREEIATLRAADEHVVQKIRGRKIP